ncbi:nuclear pore complex protein Nup88 [Galendromus occidentalis]|uniref:Nuclear pore complex protein Nup88 n=1 Tax=Galendromus occidentalis TaxID=34638 RepID=A0AAJ6QX56_9ACAR|nr:nuclear pore complex protein Nup88 [Galendromus occidentalis]
MATLQVDWRSPKSKFLSNIKSQSKASNPRQLVAHCKNLFLAWNPGTGSLHAVDVNCTEDHSYEFVPSRKLAFNVEQIESSRSGALLLWGPGGAAVVVLPDEIAMTKNSSTKCKTFPIGEIILIQIAGLEVLAAKWLPDSVNEVVLLTNDNCLRLFDITSRVTHALKAVHLLERPSSLTKINFMISAVTGGQIIDFDFGRSPDEVFCLSTAGSVYRITNFTKDKACVSDSLLMRPNIDDTFGCDGYSLLTFLLGQVVMLVVAGTAGTLYHCIVLFNEDDEEQPTLHVAEKITLSLTLDDNVDGYRCPMILEKDESVLYRYFCIHDSGVHVVAVPLNEILEGYVGHSADLDASVVDKDASSHSIAEQVVCTRTTETSPEDPPLGACVIPTYPSPTLVVLTSDGKLIDISLLRYRICPLEPTKNLLCEDLGNVENRIHHPLTDFETEIKVILGGSRVPALAQSDKTMNPKELLELSLKTTQRFRDRYLVQMSAVLRLLEEKSRIVVETKDEQRKEMEVIAKEIDTMQKNMMKLREKYDSALKKCNLNTVRLHEIIHYVQRKNPSKTDPQMINEVEALQGRAKRVESVLETTCERLDELEDLKALNGSTLDGAAEPVGKLNEEQLEKLMTKLKNNGSDIERLVREVKDLLSEVS